MSELCKTGMASVSPGVGELATDFVAHTFYTLANMPADAVNIIAMLEEELEPSDWPWWLRDGINDISEMRCSCFWVFVTTKSSHFGANCVGLRCFRSVGKSNCGVSTVYQSKFGLEHQHGTGRIQVCCVHRS